MMHGRNQGGFTLLEMLVVLAVLALVMMVSLPLMRNPSGARSLRAEAQAAAAIFRLARIEAMTSGGEKRVVADLEGRRLVYGHEILVLATDTGIAAKTAKGEIIRGEAGFRFSPGGGATGGALHLQRGGSDAVIAINWLTGAVRVDYRERP